jgi:tetratricopeptide (TPR) repeat protein
LVVRDAEKGLKLIEAETGRTLARLENPTAHNCLLASFSPDGARLIVTNGEAAPEVSVWDLRLIRRRLATMGLDWDAPAFPSEDPAAPDLAPLQSLKVDYGSLAAHLEMLSEQPQVLLDRYATQIKQNPEDVEAHHQHAHALFNLNRPAESINDLSAAIRLKPDDVHLRHLRGQAYSFGREQIALAIPDLEQALAAEPLRADIAQRLAFCCNNVAWISIERSLAPEDLDRALTMSARAVELMPNVQENLNTRGIVLYRAERYAEALAVLEQSLAVGRGRFAAYDFVMLAMVHHALGHGTAARQSLDRAMQWLSAHGSELSPQHAAELEGLRLEAESVLEGPAADPPRDDSSIMRPAPGVR